MKSVIALAVAAACTAMVAAGSAKVEVTPVAKVITLLEGMAAKGKEEKHAEGVQYAAYKQFCDDTESEKTRAISQAAEDIAILKAEIAKAGADAEALAEEIGQHDQDIIAWKDALKKATEERTTGRADYEKLHADYSESLSALDRAIKVMTDATADVPQASALLAVKKLKLVPDEAKHVMGSFLARDAAADLANPVDAPEVNAYDFQSHSVTDMLKQLKDKFTDEMTTLETEEMKAKHAYEMLKARLEEEIAEASTLREDKMKTKAKKLQTKAAKESEKASLEADKKQDEEYLAGVKATCAKKAADFESRQTLRTEEISTIEQAIEIIQKESTLHQGRYTTLQLPRKTSLANLRAIDNTQLQQRLAEYLQSRAKELNSQVLSLLAVRATQDPFGKVKKMLQELLTRLEEEAAQEADHKAWCDKEMETNKATRIEKTATVEALKAEIEELTATISQLGDKIATLAGEIEDLDRRMKEALELRNTEKAKNAETIVDAQAAQKATASALTVLKEFYREAAKAEVLVQEGAAQPAIFDSAYKGMQGESKGVIGLLEVIMSDFTRLEAETKSAESEAADEYDDFMTKSAASKSEKMRNSRHAKVSKLDAEQMKEEKDQDLTGAQKELDAALDYFEKLKPTCIDSGIKYDDRVASRQAEIESLRDAWKVLNGEEVTIR